MTNSARKRQQKEQKAAAKAKTAEQSSSAFSRAGKELHTVPTKEQFNQPTSPVDIRKGVTAAPKQNKKNFKKWLLFAGGAIIGCGAGYYLGGKVIDHFRKEDGVPEQTEKKVKKTRVYGWEKVPGAHNTDGMLLPATVVEDM